MRIRAVARKELAHILRDPTSLTIVLIMPVIMMIIYGYAINFDLDTVELGVVNNCIGEPAMELVEAFSHNNYYKVTYLTGKYPDPLAAGETMLKSGDLKSVMIILADFSRKIQRGQQAEVGIILDGSDSNVANLVYQYNEQVLSSFMMRYIGIETQVDINTKIMFNPESKSSYFFIPGMLALLMLMSSALLTSLSVAKEKESGSIDLIYVSPLRSHEIIIGKTLPNILVALTNGALIVLLARFWFHIPIRGSLMTLFLFSLIYIVTGLALGIMISTVASSQKAAMFATLLVTILPSIMLSGFIFPLESLSWFLRMVSRIVPATYFLDIVRGVIAKGSQLHHFIKEGFILIGMAVFLLTVASIRFRVARRHPK